MAKIPVSAGNERTYKITKFLGLNQSPDGDTELKTGEAADMRNFRITAEGSLQIRPGYAPVTTLADSHPVRGMWHGYVGGAEKWLAACNGHIWSINLTTHAATDLGALTDAVTRFFCFGGKVYIMNGTQYYSWSGAGSIASVTGYVPIITIAAAPATGAGTANDRPNILNNSKWVWYSSTSSSTIYQLPETALTSIDTVMVDDVVVTTGFTASTAAGTVTFDTAPGEGTNDVKIKYTKISIAMALVRSSLFDHKYAELFNGYTDTRVFLYGGASSNQVYYSGLEYSTGLPTAEYFPDLNVLNVGASNTPVTSLVRHFNKLMAFKTDETHLIYYGTLTLDDSTVTAGFYTRPIDKDAGNAAVGQVSLVNNYPISLFGNSAYRWGLVYSSGTQDERASKRISDRVRATLGGFTASSAITFDDEWNREFWIVDTATDEACVYQYANEAQGDTSYKNNVWYTYDNIPATCFVSVGGELYFGSDDGYIMHMSRDYHSDAGEEIDAYWESGSMYFDKDNVLKFSNDVWLAMKPESQARVTVTAQSNSDSNYAEEEVASNLSTFLHTDFNHFSFGTNRKPQVKHVRLKVNKFVYYKLIFSSLSASATATVLSADIKVRDAGYVK